MNRRLAVLLLVPVLALTAACGSSSDNKPKAKGTPSPSQTSAAGGGSCSYPTDGQQPAKKATPPSAKPTSTGSTAVTISTNVGDIKVTLDGAKAPCTVNSFLSLAKQGYFDNTKCHRLTTNGIFVLQCGDPSGSGSGGPGYSFNDELVKNDPRLQPCQTVQGQNGLVQVCTYGAGTLAMANAGPNTNGSQFFLVYKDSQLPNAYTDFGRMSAGGLQTVTKVAKGGVAGGGPDGPPKTAVTITSVK